MMNSSSITYPVLPLRNVVIYPGLNFPLIVARKRSLASLSAASTRAAQEPRFVCLTQKETNTEDPKAEDLYTIGTLVALRRTEKQPNDSVQIVAEGLRRVNIRSLETEETCLTAQVEILPNMQSDRSEMNTTLLEVYRLGQKLAEIHGQKFRHEKTLKETVGNIRDLVVRIYRIVSLMPGISISQQQQILETNTYEELLTCVHEILVHECQASEIRMEIVDKAKRDMEQQQREAMLRHQKKIIEGALGESDSELSETEELRQRLEQKELPEIARKEAKREIRRMERMSANSADFQIARTYVELILELPWLKETEDRLDIKTAHRILDEDHFGLEEVKERILEHLAVLQMNPKAKASILCFLGPPGVGKTSLGKSIARALKRKFEHISLGGMHDESELRGHRRTYIGAMPGRIVQAIRRAEIKNPLIMLDEIDKLGRDYRGDPGSALMEILDPAQNVEFRDNYLNLPFDLSRTMFIATANTLDTIPKPLLDRMEVLELSGYSDMEKEEIAKRYLIPKQRQEAGLLKKHLNIYKYALMEIIHSYTREAGVRELERTIARIARRQARRILEGEKIAPISTGRLVELLGPQRFFRDKTRAGWQPGVVTGLAWTQAGGEILYVEAIRIAKEENLTLTGQLGSIMRESAMTARSYIWAIAPQLGIDRKVIETNEVHIHLPTGAVPKDGPSAGITIATALVSLYSSKPVHKEVAMTGEITLTGLILPVGGIREKVLAAHRNGIKTVILPKENANTLNKPPDHVRGGMKFILVEKIIDVIKAAIDGYAPQRTTTKGKTTTPTKTTRTPKRKSATQSAGVSSNARKPNPKTRIPSSKADKKPESPDETRQPTAEDATASDSNPLPGDQESPDPEPGTSIADSTQSSTKENEDTRVPAGEVESGKAQAPAAANPEDAETTTQEPLGSNEGKQTTERPGKPSRDT